MAKAHLTVTFEIEAADENEARQVKLDLEGDVTNLITNYRGEAPNATWIDSKYSFFPHANRRPSRESI